MNSSWRRLTAALLKSPVHGTLAVAAASLAGSVTSQVPPPAFSSPDLTRPATLFSAPEERKLLDANACRRNLKGVLGELRRTYGIPAKPVMADVTGARSPVPLVTILRDGTAVALDKAADTVKLPLRPVSPNTPPTHGRWNGGVVPPSTEGSSAAALPLRAPLRAGQPIRGMHLPSPFTADAISPLSSMSLPALPRGGYEIVLKGYFGAAAPPAIASATAEGAVFLGPPAGTVSAQASAATAVLFELSTFYEPAVARFLGTFKGSASPALLYALADGAGVVCLDVSAGQLIIDVSAAPFVEVRWRTLSRQQGSGGNAAVGLTQDDVDAVASVFAVAARTFRFGGDAGALHAGPPAVRLEAATLELRTARIIPEQSLLRRSAESIEAAFDRLVTGSCEGDEPAEWWARHAGLGSPVPALLATPPPGVVGDALEGSMSATVPKSSTVAGLLSRASARVIVARDEVALIKEASARVPPVAQTSTEGPGSASA